MDIYACGSWEYANTFTAETSYEPIGLATKWLRILLLDGIDKIRSHLVVKSILSDVL